LISQPSEATPAIDPQNCAVKNSPARWSVKDHRPISTGKIGPISVVTIPAITNPPWRTTDAAEEVGSKAGRVWIELMLKAVLPECLPGQASASGKM
jgi:hypothetical protein